MVVMMVMVVMVIDRRRGRRIIPPDRRRVIFVMVVMVVMMMMVVVVVVMMVMIISTPIRLLHLRRGIAGLFRERRIAGFQRLDGIGNGPEQIGIGCDGQGLRRRGGSAAGGLRARAPKGRNPGQCAKQPGGFPFHPTLLQSTQVQAQ